MDEDNGSSGFKGGQQMRTEGKAGKQIITNNGNPPPEEGRMEAKIKAVPRTQLRLKEQQPGWKTGGKKWICMPPPSTLHTP